MTEPSGVGKAIGVHVLALCGESLLIEGIEASLKDRGGLEIVRISTSQPRADQVLDELSPDVIVFDLTPNQLSCVFTYLRTHTDVLLIGLDIDSDLALFLSGEWQIVPTIDVLMQVIEARIQVKKGR